MLDKAMVADVLNFISEGIGREVSFYGEIAVQGGVGVVFGYGLRKGFITISDTEKKICKNNIKNLIMAKAQQSILSHNGLKNTV